MIMKEKEYNKISHKNPIIDNYINMGMKKLILN